MSEFTTQTYTREQLVSEAIRRGYRFTTYPLGALGPAVLIRSMRLCVLDSSTAEPDTATEPESGILHLLPDTAKMRTSTHVIDAAAAA